MQTDNYLITSIDGNAHYFDRFMDAFDQWVKDGKDFRVKQPTRKLAGVKFVWCKLSVEQVNSIAATNPTGN